MGRFCFSLLNTLLVLFYGSYALAFEYKDFEADRCTVPQMKALRVAVDDLINTGGRVLDELDLIESRGEDSTGFNTFFTSKGSVRTVKDIVLKVTDAASIKRFDEFGIEADFPPTFICVNPEDTMVVKAYEGLCLSGRNAAGWAEKTQFIFICPSFFRLPEITGENARLKCPAVVNGKWPKNPTSFGLDEAHILVHELTHAYLGLPQLRPEVVSLQGAHDLPPETQLRNAANYALYWSCE